MHLVVVCFAVIVTLFAPNSNASIYEIVGNAYKLALVVAFIPLVFGLYWKRASSQGALFSIVLGLASWLLEMFNAEGLWPPQLVGLLTSCAGMVIGSMLNKKHAIRMSDLFTVYYFIIFSVLPQTYITNCN